MQQNYNVDDSDSDDEVAVKAIATIPKNTTWDIHDIEKLKSQTSELLDSNWKDTRNKHLLNKMLDLEQPSITVKMVDFLLQDGVCETLLGFITMNGTGAVRPAPSDSTSPALKKSYRAVILLSPDSPTEALNSFLSKKATLITQKIFDIFKYDSSGSFYHAYRLLESLLRCYPTEVFEGICSDGKVQERMTNMLRYIGFPPVCELLIMLISLTPVPRTGQLYNSCVDARWVFLDELIKWNFLLRICKVISYPESHCALDSYINADQHATAAAQLFQEIIEKLSLEESGETLMAAIGENSDILDILMDTLVKPRMEAIDGLRRASARMVCFLLRRAADVEILCYTHHPNGAPPTANYVPNHLFGLRENIVNQVKSRLYEVLNFLQDFDSFNQECKAPTKYSSYEIGKPFTSLRSLAVEVVVLMVESDESIASTILTTEVWVTFINWTLKYAYNNVFHALMYRIVFAVLRQDQEASQRLLFQKAKFASFLIENFVPISVGTPSQAAKSAPSPVAKDLIVRRIACRGLIMNCANAIRLQVNADDAPQNSYLKSFFRSHTAWKESLLPKLTAATELQMEFGMGVEVDVSADNVKVTNERGGAPPVGSLAEEVMALSSEDRQVRFARSLGFYEEGNWQLSRASMGGKDDDKHLMMRRRSFEEGYGSFSDFVDESPSYVVDEIDMARKVTSKSNPSSPEGAKPPQPPH
mmetsp:Transcript_28969/g.48687  ORF Transcript_28969/g.48687 Transcript_28969/m.48687 type:complete len:702 (+) Transcript_28969:108-2213(+)